MRKEPTLIPAKFSHPGEELVATQDPHASVSQPLDLSSGTEFHPQGHCVTYNYCP